MHYQCARNAGWTGEQKTIGILWRDGLKCVLCHDPIARDEGFPGKYLVGLQELLDKRGQGFKDRYVHGGASEYEIAGIPFIGSWGTFGG